MLVAYCVYQCTVPQTLDGVRRKASHALQQQNVQRLFQQQESSGNQDPAQITACVWEPAVSNPWHHAGRALQVVLVSASPSQLRCWCS